MPSQRLEGAAGRATSREALTPGATCGIGAWKARCKGEFWAAGPWGLGATRENRENILPCWNGGPPRDRFKPCVAGGSSAPFPARGPSYSHPAGARGTRGARVGWGREVGHCKDIAASRSPPRLRRARPARRPRLPRPRTCSRRTHLRPPSGTGPTTPYSSTSPIRSGGKGLLWVLPLPRQAQSYRNPQPGAFTSLFRSGASPAGPVLAVLGLRAGRAPSSSGSHSAGASHAAAALPRGARARQGSARDSVRRRRLSAGKGRGGEKEAGARGGGA